MKRLTLESFNDLRINISGCLACISSFVAIQKDSHEVSSNCHPTQKQWSRKYEDTCVIRYVYRVYYNLDWYTYCFLKGDIRRAWKIWSCQVDRRFEHGHTWATPRSCHGARKLATIRCVDFLHLWIFYAIFLIVSSSLQCFSIPTVAGLRISFGSLLLYLSFPLHAGLCWSLYHRLHHLPVCYPKIQR